MKRKLSQCLWLMSFKKWVNKTKEAAAGEYNYRGYCGYCIDAKGEGSCDDCLLPKKVCYYNVDNYYYKWTRVKPKSKEKLKYSRLILRAIAKQGRQWGYMTKERESEFNKVMEDKI